MLLIKNLYARGGTFPRELLPLWWWLRLDPNITYVHSCWCNQYKTNAAIFSPRSALCPVLFHLVRFFTPNDLPCYKYQGAQKMSGRMCQGSCSMLHMPSNHNMPQTCMAWAQNMSKNTKVKKNGVKDRRGEKELQQYSINNYRHM